ncbi:chorismate mutase [Bacillus sp. OV322]|uniref:chorismate mutase n=1 Tax=Bacillus sp. OV322 TaxID=1882764 RepID=UPI0008F43F98|nr:chorismate mutase [Bacillus sp. OV322]SFC44998.1 chorismate mutase [Bacillus sp. OV322]
MIRGVRGATTVNKDTEKDVIEASEKLLSEMISANGIEPDLVASVFISVTEDISSAFPAKALRQVKGWKYVPVMCMTEIPVTGSLPACIRMMVHWNTEKSQQDIQHIYQEKAVALRPDLKEA